MADQADQLRALEGRVKELEDKAATKEEVAAVTASVDRTNARLASVESGRADRAGRKPQPSDPAPVGDPYSKPARDNE